MRLPVTIVAIGLVAASLGPTLRAVRPAPPAGLVIITLDTTRADRLPIYGYSGVTTPAIDSVANRGVVFDDAETVAPLTLTAHTSVFTGLYPPHHGVRENTNRLLSSDHPTLAEIVHTHGFRTAAFVGSAVLAADRGLSRGFDVYDDGGAPGAPTPHRRPGADVVDRANAWIRSLDHGVPFFLWVHLYDVHAPQALPLEFRRVYGDRYEGGIAYADAQIGRLLDALRDRGTLDKTVVVIAGDHGESLGEHGEKDHGLLVYQSTMRVPLIIVAPGLPPRRLSMPTSLVDVLPTVLDLFGMRAPDVDGRSAVPAVHGADPPERLIYGESTYPLHFGLSPLRMIRDGQFKFIDAAKPELYDLERDPVEQQNVADKHLATVSALCRKLQGMSTGAAQDVGPRLSPDRLRALEALGYVNR